MAAIKCAKCDRHFSTKFNCLRHEGKCKKIGRSDENDDTIMTNGQDSGGDEVALANQVHNSPVDTPVKNMVLYSHPPKIVPINVNVNGLKRKTKPVKKKSVFFIKGNRRGRLQRIRIRKERDKAKRMHYRCKRMVQNVKNLCHELKTIMMACPKCVKNNLAMPCLHCEMMSVMCKHREIENDRD